MLDRTARQYRFGAPQQRLHCPDLSTVHIHFRLVVDREHPAAHRAVDRLDIARPPVRLVVQLVGEIVVAVAVAVLDLVERQVGLAQQLVAVARILRIHADADADPDADVDPVHVVRLRQRRDQFPGDSCTHFRRARVGLQHHELVASDPRHQVGFADLLEHALGRLAQYEVADMVPKPVIYLFETIQVDQLQDQQSVVPRGGRGHVPEPFVELRAIGQPGKRVDTGKPGHLHFRLALLGGVAQDLDVALELTGRPENRRHHAVGPEGRPVLAKVPADVIGATPAARCFQFPVGYAVVPVVHREQGTDRLTDDLLGRVSEDVFRARVPRPDVAVRIEHDDAVVLGADQDRIQQPGPVPCRVGAVGRFFFHHSLQCPLAANPVLEDAQMPSAERIAETVRRTLEVSR